MKGVTETFRLKLILAIDKHFFIDKLVFFKGALSRILTDFFEKPKFIFVSKETKK